MATVNHKLENLTVDEVKEISNQYLRGWVNLQKEHQIMLRGLNKKRVQYGLEPISRDDVRSFQVNYAKSHYSHDTLLDLLEKYMQTHSMDKSRFSGILLYDCLFSGNSAISTLKEIIGKKDYDIVSEKTRVAKMMKTQKDIYGGVGLANQKAMEKSRETRTKELVDTLENCRLTGDFTPLIDYTYSTKPLLSRFEYEVLMILLTRFDANDVKLCYGRYPKDERYPFDCDFYIKSLDLFIEMNGYYSHGDHWFDENNQEDINLFNRLDMSDSEFNKRASFNWRYSDPKKREIAKRNNLNYLVFWDGRSRNRNGYEARLLDFRLWFYDFDCDTVAFLKEHPENTY